MSTAFLTNMIANISGNYNSQYFGIANFWKLWLLTFRKIICPGLREVIIYKMLRNIVATLKLLAGIFYLVVRRPMLYYMYAHLYTHVCMYVYMYVCMYTCMYVCIYTIYVYMYSWCIYMYTYTHMYTYYLKFCKMFEKT